MSTMKSIIIEQNGGPEVLLYKEVPKPTVKAGHILVKNSFCGVNFIDTILRTGIYKDTLPMSLGKEASGVVEAVSDGITGIKKGDRVAYMAENGAYSEYTLTTPKHTVVLPENITEKTGAAAIFQGLTAYCLATRAYPVKKGDWVLIHAAAGGTGRLLVQICKALGANVIGTTSTEEKAQLARQAGAQHIIYYTKENITDRVKEITNGEGVHAAFDSVGKDTFQASLDSLRRLGHLISFGNASGKIAPIEISILAKWKHYADASPGL